MNAQPISSTALTLDQATALLHVGLAGASRPIDALMDRLSEPDSAAWMTSALRAFLSDEQIEAIQQGSADENLITQVKHRAKSVLNEASSHQEHLAALTGYLLSVASGLVLHNRLLSSRSGDEWAEVLADLAGVVPLKWRDLVSRAAELALTHGG